MATVSQLKTKFLLITFLLVFFYSGVSIGQCAANHVIHKNGSIVMNGITVTATPKGQTDLYNYCPSTFPYLIGSTVLINYGQGSYTFTFLPAIDTITLNFSGITNLGIHQEIIVLTVNGVHYSIPSVGISNGCNPLAVLTASGDIAGCTSCNTSGWSGTTIPGPIDSITILDSVVSGIPNGALFSLFFCGKYVAPDPTGTELTASIYPNPFHNILNVALNDNKTAKIIIYDITAREILTQLFTKSVLINTNRLAGGVYVYKIISGNKMLKKGKLIKL